MKKFRKVSGEIIVNLSKEKVWDMVFTRFGEVNDFNPLIEGSVPFGELEGQLGAERKCDLSPTSKVHEKITAVHGTNSFDIDILEGGLPLMSKMKGTWEIEELNSRQTKARIIFNYRTKPGLMAGFLRKPMAKQLRRMVIGLKYHLETGGKVTKQNIKDIVREYNRIPSNASFQTQVRLAIAA